ncbi:hypothetical protein BCR37DRAFT_366825 [Protomyces lactucae-debilis]|uniref:Plasma membrane fusion protein PRM1 n=1 Tax=Protomyces lactucae-debilis TaxID=2754530 RepID=A0A1Y2FIU5_PROLT|nr:uncharacterized protein BCR37DRAFT_366825 [Protomyces lactucae-debilis]ORY83868.1 hypothetical protein BCR37DRAFT_366825 [Protomyces lactucae-debilis]
MSRPLHQHAREFSNEALYNLNEALGNPYLQPEQRKESLPKPYLGLGARLSQVWLNQWTVLLILVAVRLAIAASSLRGQLEDGREQVQAACSALEVTASTALSVPHYVARGANSLVAISIDASVTAVAAVLQGLLTAVEEIVLFFINTFKSTYICLLELAVEGSIGAVLDAVETIGNVLNSTLKALGEDIQEATTDANSAINKVAGFIEKASAFLGQKLDIPTVAIPLAPLQDFQIPSSFDQGLDKARSALNLDAVQNATDAVIRLPFEQLKILVDARFDNFAFNKSLLPVPSKETLSFCAEAALDETFDDVVDGVMKTYHIILALLIVFAALIALFFAGLAVWQWRTLNRHAHMAAALSKEIDADPLERLLIATHPLQYQLTTKLTRTSHPRSRQLVRWWVAYVSHGPAAFVLLLAIAGLLSCALQAIMLHSLQSATPDLAESAGQVTAQVEALLSSKATAWANDTNVQIGTLQGELNNDLLGWVTTGTETVNQTLNVFTDTLIETLKVTFGGTILYEPILSVFNCLLLVKIRGIETGLTWVHEQAHINLPVVPASTLMLQLAGDDALMDKSPGQSVSEGITSILAKVAKLWRKSIKQEAITAGILLGVWVLVALLGLLRCLFVGTHVGAWFASMPILGPLRKSDISQPLSIQRQTARIPDSASSFGQRGVLPALARDDKSSLHSDTKSRLSEVTDLDALYMDRETAPIVERVGLVPKIHALLGQVPGHHKSVVPITS